MSSIKNRDHEFITRKEFENEIKAINFTLRTLNDHVIKANYLQEITNEKLSTIQESVTGESDRAVFTRLNNLEKKEAKMSTSVKCGFAILTTIIMLEPFYTKILQIVKIHA